MKYFRIISAFVVLTFCAGLVSAQSWSEDLIQLDIRTVYSAATGNSNASAYVLWPESFVGTSEAEELYSSIESYTGNPDEQISKLFSDLKENLDAQISAARENIEYYSSMNTSGGADPKDILDKVLRHSVNHKVYHGAFSIGKGLWAVSESLNEDGPRHQCLGGWGVIDASGRTVIDFKYDFIVEADETHGLIKYGTGCPLQTSVIQSRGPGAQTAIW